MTQDYFNQHIHNLLVEYEGNNDRRDFTYDYCQLYFQQHPRDYLIEHLEQSCFVLWGYLAGFGMLRGKAQLLQNNPSILVPVIEYVSNNQLYDIDLEHYSNRESRDRIITAYNGINDSIHNINPSITLISKIMMGVYTCLPAFDSNFSKFINDEWGLHVNLNHLDEILQRIYEECNEIIFPQLHLRQFDGRDSDVSMKKIRYIDRLGWEAGA